jgi:hypothetical protein
MDVNVKGVVFGTWGKHLLLDISSANIDTLVPSLYQFVETRSVEVFDCCLSLFRASFSTSSSSAKLLPPSWF